MRKRLLLSCIICLLLVFRMCTSLASGITDFLDFGANGEPVSFRVHTEILKLPQFDENRTQQLNKLLKHVGFHGIVSEKDAEITLSIDDEGLFSILSFEQNGRKRTILAPDQEHYYIVPDGEKTEAGMIPVSGGEAAEIEENLSIYHTLETVVSLLEKLPDVFPDKASRAKCTDKYRDYGTAASKVVLKLTDEEMNQYLQKYLEDLNGNFADARLRSLRFSGRQGFTLLFTEDNRLLKVSYSGKAAWEEDDVRDIRLDWKTARREGYARDELQLRTPNEKRTKRNNLILRFSQKTEEDGSEKLAWTKETDRLENKIRTQASFAADISMREGKMEGTIVHSSLQNNRKDTCQMTLDLSAPDENSWSGTLEIISKKDKIETEHFRSKLALKAGVTAQVSAIQPEPVLITGEEFSRITENLYSDILRKLLTLPAEDLAFIREGIPDALWNSSVNQ